MNDRQNQATRRTGRLAALAVVPMAVLALAACGSGGSSDEGDGGSGDESCALRVEYADVTFTDVAAMPSKPTELLGQGTQLGCSDSNGETGKGESVDVYRVDGLDPKVAVAVGDQARLLRVDKGSQVPAEITSWLSKHSASN